MVISNLNIKKTLLIDTGGISQSNDGLKGAISQQAWIAVQESSLIILLIDGSEDLSKEDLEIITNLRKLNKEFITVVNKIDKKIISTSDAKACIVRGGKITNVAKNNVKGPKNLRNFRKLII